MQILLWASRNPSVPKKAKTIHVLSTESSSAQPWKDRSEEQYSRDCVDVLARVGSSHEKMSELFLSEDCIFVHK